ncbi:N6-adenine methyltransferase [Haloarcula virus HVTV-2]|uniref:site-specific DNA-methyltransferase (adenine-specific) n=1 Tax=Haloarcula vallismortis tailed virus 1 TaxID=1262528 RepID=L7TJ93_9CAUD|nr:DNA methyltransferase [Haloarcula vallismortis tailed virus 1]AGC34458.1 N6-adenine DNA methyltransferase [Haloarcula vallismortis tailed virus 1]UBF22896.1 N6-adenine methyltransferase [Haloarcula virus HVTV-2]
MPKKNTGTVNYPGGKTTLAPWIISHFPEHECYVEPFGGSASVLFNKPRSTIEVYNDVYGRVVNYFEVCRDRGDELREWLEMTPYSRELYEEYSQDLEDGKEPDDEVARAGRFFYLQTTSFSAKPNGGFRINTTARSPADETTHKYEKSKEQVSRVADRFKEVIIENLDFEEVVTKYDSTNCLFYCDPPYVGDRSGNKYYAVGNDFDHARFAELITDVDGDVVISYDELPDVLETKIDKTWFVSEKKRRYSSSMDSSQNVERLVMNFNPDEASFDTQATDVLDF